MKKVTYEQFLNFGPCWLESEEGRKKLRKYKVWWGDGKTALDVLSLEEVDADDRLWTVLRPEFIEESILHEFACQCAERALSRVDNPDSRSVNAIKAKRAWLRGEISDDELCTAQDVVWDTDRVASHVVFHTTSCATVCAATHATYRSVSRETGLDKERQWQVNELIKLLG